MSPKKPKWFQRWPHRKPTTPATSDLVGSETPIRTASEDLLRRGSFVLRIVEILSTSNVREGRVFAIRSAWGTGKSSLKNLIVEELGKRETKARWLEFNPWQWGDGDAIARALFLQMATKLGGRYSPQAHRRSALLRRYGAIVVGAANPLKGADDDKRGLAAWGTIIALGSAGLSLQIPAWLNFPNIPVTTLVSWALLVSAGLLIVGKAMTALGKDRTSESLDSVREHLEFKLKKLESPLIVFVDDIDRLEPDQIRLLIRQVKVNANLPNIVFVLIFQPSIVISALDPVSNDSGADYLEKIVQANFDLPAIPREKISAIFAEQLGNMVDHLATDENGFEQVRWGNLLVGSIQPFIRNLRDARRLLSSIAIHYPLHQGEKTFEVNLIDFLGLETLRVFEPAVHTAIANNKALLLQSNRMQRDGAQKRNQEQIESVLAKSSPLRRESTKDLLVELFPTISGVLGGSSYGDDWIKSWLNKKCVCTERMFDRYFELQITEGGISESDIATVFENSANAENLKSTIQSLKDDGRLPSLATRLDEAVENIPLENISTILPEIFEIGQFLNSNSDDPFNSPYISTWRAAVWYLRRVPEPEKRAEAMQDALEASDALAVPAVLLSLDQDARDKGDPSRELLFTDPDFERLKALWVGKVRDIAADSDRLLNADDLVSLLYRWRDFSGSFDEPRKWVDGKKSEHLPELLSRFVTVGRSHGMGDHVSKRFERFDRKVIEDFFDLASLRSSIEMIDPKTVSADQARILDILKREAANWVAIPSVEGNSQRSD